MTALPPLPGPRLLRQAPTDIDDDGDSESEPAPFSELEIQDTVRYVYNSTRMDKVNKCIRITKRLTGRFNHRDGGQEETSALSYRCVPLANPTLPYPTL